MKLTRSQIITLVVLGVLTMGVYGCLVGTVVINSRQGVQPPPTEAATLLPQKTTAPTDTPVPPPTPTITPSPTPIAPQTRYDLQITTSPNDPALRLQRGYAYIELAAYTYAVGDFDAALEADNSLSEAYLGRGIAHFYLKDWSTALDDWKQAQNSNPELAEAFTWRGRVLSLQGKHRLALDELHQAIALDETNPDNHLALADALLRSGEQEKATLEYTTVLSSEVRSVEAYVGRAMALTLQGDFATAEADLKSAEEIAPHDPAVLNAQARFYGWYGRGDLDTAARMAQLAVNGARGDLEKALYLDTLGRIYYDQKRYGEAVTALEQAADLATVEGHVIYTEIPGYLEEAKKALEP